MLSTVASEAPPSDAEASVLLPSLEAASLLLSEEPSLEALSLEEVLSEALEDSLEEPADSLEPESEPALAEADSLELLLEEEPEPSLEELDSLELSLEELDSLELLDGAELVVVETLVLSVAPPDDSPSAA